MTVAASLLGSTVVRAWHGLAAAPDAHARPAGMKVAAVAKQSPAADSGLRAGDVVTAVGDLPVRRALDFQRAMLDRSPGEQLTLAVQRDGKPLTMSLELAEIPDTLRPAVSPAWELLGLELKPIPAVEFRQKYQTRYRGGLAVVDVRANSPASEQGVRAGDVLVGMHIWETVSMDNVAYILKRPDFNAINPVKFFILRGNETLYGYLSVAVKVARQP